MYHISSRKSENQEVFWTFHVCSHANQRQENVQESVLQLGLLLFFAVLVKGIQRLFSAKYLGSEGPRAQFFFLTQQQQQQHLYFLH